MQLFKTMEEDKDLDLILPLVGNVKSIVEKSYTVKMKGGKVTKKTLYFQNIQEFNTTGKPIKKHITVVLGERTDDVISWQYNEEGALVLEERKAKNFPYKHLYKYDEQGRLIEEPWGDFQRKISYDALGNATEVYYYNKKGALEWRNVWVNDPHGNVIEEVRYTASGELIGKETAAYDAQHRKILGEEFTADGQRTERTTYKYNKLGLLTDRILIVYADDNPDEITMRMVQKCLYDDKGRLLENSFVDTANLNDEMGANYLNEYHYNEAGLMVQKRIYDIQGDLPKDQRPTRPTAREEYTYDSTGNWVKKVTYENGNITEIETREIIYY